MKAWLASAVWFAFFLLRRAGNCLLVSFSLRRAVCECGYPVARDCWYLLRWNAQQKRHRRQIFQKKIIRERWKITVLIGSILVLRARSTVKGNSSWHKGALQHCVTELLSQCRSGWDFTQRAELLSFLLNRSPFMISYLAFYITTLSLKNTYRCMKRARPLTYTDYIFNWRMLEAWHISSSTSWPELLRLVCFPSFPDHQINLQNNTFTLALSEWEVLYHLNKHKAQGNGWFCAIMLILFNCYF